MQYLGDNKIIAQRLPDISSFIIECDDEHNRNCFNIILSTQFNNKFTVDFGDGNSVVMRSTYWTVSHTYTGKQKFVVNIISDNPFFIHILQGNTCFIRNMHLSDDVRKVLCYSPETLKMRNICLPNIEQCVFSSCTSISKITYIEPQPIDNRSFALCGVQELHMPNVVDIGDFAFCGCTNLTNIEFLQSTNTSGYTIGEYSFFGCTNIEKIKVPFGFSYVSQRAFNGCMSLSLIDFPQTTRIIGNYSLPNNDGLVVIIRSETPPVLGGGNYSNFFFIVPDGCSNDYITNGWGQYGTVTEMSAYNQDYLW